jgi:transposase-like protein
VPLRERTGVLVLRVWIEAGSEEFRARITAESELGAGERVTAVAGSLDEILEFIRRWVDDFISADDQESMV